MENPSADTVWTAEQWTEVANAVAATVKAGETPAMAAWKHIGTVRGDLAWEAFLDGWGGYRHTIRLPPPGCTYTGSLGWQAGRDARLQSTAKDDADRM